jgi:hypothetical protein
MVPHRHGHIDQSRPDGKARDYYDLFNPNQRVNDVGAKTGVRLYFGTYEEAENFRQSVFTSFYKYVIAIYKKTTSSVLSKYPMMWNYYDPWTNERFRRDFELTFEELDEIIETMKPFQPVPTQEEIDRNTKEIEEILQESIKFFKDMNQEFKEMEEKLKRGETLEDA